MTLTYLGPTVGAGDLIVPAASDVELDPLLAEAVLWYDGTDLPVGWEPSDGLPNKGTGGPGLDGALLTTNPKPAGGGAAVTAESITVVEGGVEVEFSDGDTTERVAGCFAVPDNAVIQIDGDDSGMWTLDFTVGDLVDGGADTTQKFFDFYEGASIPKVANPDPLVCRGGVMEWVDNVGGGPGSGGLLAAVNDNTLPYGYAILTFPRYDIGERVRWSVKIDRVGGFMSMWMDGVEIGTPVGVTDTSGQGGSGALGSLAGVCTPFVGNHMIFHHLLFHPDGTAGFDAPAALHSSLGI